MGRADFVIYSALAAFAVGTIESAAYVFYEVATRPSVKYAEFRPWYVFVVLPFPVAAAISAYLSTRDPRFLQRTQWAETRLLCLIAYIVYAPVLGVSLFLAPETFLHGWGDVVFLFAFPLVVAFSIIPFLWVEYRIVGMARPRRSGG